MATEWENRLIDWRTPAALQTRWFVFVGGHRRGAGVWANWGCVLEEDSVAVLHRWSVGRLFLTVSGQDKEFVPE